MNSEDEDILCDYDIPYDQDIADEKDIRAGTNLTGGEGDMAESQF